MSESESFQLTVLRIWAAMAWADGTVADEEAASFRQIVRSSTELSEGEQQTALGYLERRVQPDLDDLQDLELPVRQGIYQAAVRLSAIDSHVHEHELEFLKLLQRKLYLDDATARRIEAQARPAT